MKIRIFLDVEQSDQLAMTSAILCGDSPNPYIPSLAKNYKRYEIVVDVPHVTDAEPLDITSVAEVKP